MSVNHFNSCSQHLCTAKKIRCFSFPSYGFSLVSPRSFTVGHVLGRLGTVSLHSTGIIAKPQGRFFYSPPSMPSTQLRCVVPHGHLCNYARIDVEVLSSARRRDSCMPTVDVACKRATHIIVQHTASTETDRNVSVRSVRE